MKHRKTLKLLIQIAANLCRLIIGLTFTFSGFVKAIDPLGTQYKIQDYLAAVGMADLLPSMVSLGASVLLSMVEFTIGILVLFAIGRKFISRIALAFMVVMTLITVWIFYADPVQDCGCFGDAIVLSNGATLIKNLVLLACSIILFVWPREQFRMLNRSNQWIVVHYTIIFSIVLSIWSLYDLPAFDFRPYSVGSDIRAKMEVPEDAEQPEFNTTFILEKDGVRKEFNVDNYPDSTWTFIDQHTEVIKEGYQPPIHDFSIMTIDADHDDITDDILYDPGYTFLLISPWLDKADDSNFGYIDEINEYAQDNGARFLCLTSSDTTAISQWRNLTGAEYYFCNTDGTTLKTIIRSNPGLLLMKDGKILAKWSHNNLPHGDMLKTPIDKAEWAVQDPEAGWYHILYIALWFFVPLILLIIADRLWAWSQWVKNKEKKNLNIIKSTTLKNQNQKQ